MTEEQKTSRYVLWGATAIIAIVVGAAVVGKYQTKAELDQRFQKQQDKQGPLHDPQIAPADTFREKMRELDAKENPPIDWDSVTKEIERTKSTPPPPSR